MKKLLIATDAFLPRWDGISSFLNDTIPHIQDDFELSIVAPNLGKLPVKYKAKIHRFKTLKVRIGDNYYPPIVNPFKLFSMIRKADLVWVQGLAFRGIFSIIFSKILRKKVVFYNHMFEWEVYPSGQGIDLLKVPINLFVKFVSIILYNLCDTIIVPSLEHSELLSIMKIKSKKKVVHLGVNVKHYVPPVSKGDAKKKIGIDPDKFVVGFAGRVSLEKDPKTLYRAYMRFRKIFPGSMLLVAGGGRPDLERLFSKHEDIMFTGLKDDLAPYYQAMDVYVLPSLTETTSLTTMEAMATGLPVVVTPVGFIREYIDDGNNGLLFTKKNSYELYRKLAYLKENEKDRETLGKNARKTIVDKYTWEKTVTNLKKVLLEL